MVGLTLAAPAPRLTQDTIKDRKAFIPNRKYQSLPGTVVGVLVSDVQAMMGQEGRGGPNDAMGYSANGNSYRWMYVPVTENVQINNLTVETGEKGDGKKTYPFLGMASPTTVKQWGIDVPYALVEINVNDGLGSPAIEGFVATHVKRLDGTKDYPLNVVKVIADLRKRYQRHVKDEQKTLEAALAKEQKVALKDKKPTGPRKTEELFYVTWLPKTQHLRVHFRTRVSDGAYQTTDGIRPRPIPLPVPPKDKQAPAQDRLKQAVRGPAAVALSPPPPPRPIGFRYGTTFGVEFGVAYEVDKKGKVDKILTLPFEGFHHEIPPPPMRGPRGGIRDLPPPPAKKS
jgi:hypothetical protein